MVGAGDDVITREEERREQDGSEVGSCSHEKRSRVKGKLWLILAIFDGLHKMFLFLLALIVKFPNFI